MWESKTLSVVFDPAKILLKVAPKSKIKKLLTRNLTLKKAALGFVKDSEVVDPKSVTSVALKVVNAYQDRIEREVENGLTKKEVVGEILADPKLLIQRVQNEVIFQMHDRLKANYQGQVARWLPSSADEPRPEHQLNYGKTYIVGEGIDGVEPGDEYGCQCGVEILNEDGPLNLTD